MHQIYIFAVKNNIFNSLKTQKFPLITKQFIRQVISKKISKLYENYVFLITVAIEIFYLNYVEKIFYRSCIEFFLFR